ncbi:hypothetical protein CIHG_06638 [Coccidioides immitis H538.4]|uniref:Uncharacterized protein n=1 Tax=Coccidioides immitis H538.4 TaxID=396776 RepID=A0A0J8RV95_COCIT|nr:hypothetical protein CIHG_06638 [Coccidioides immitis H538.4]
MASPLNETSPSRIPFPSALSLTIANVRARGCPWLLEGKDCLHESSGYLGSISERMGAVVAVDNRTDFCVWSGAVVKHMAFSMAATCKAQVAMHISRLAWMVTQELYLTSKGRIRDGSAQLCGVVREVTNYVTGRTLFARPAAVVRCFGQIIALYSCRY